MASNRYYSPEAMQSLGNVVQSSLKRNLACCPNCDNFDAMGERCKLNSLHPPAPIIAFGCELFTWNDCPF